MKLKKELKEFNNMSEYDMRKELTEGHRRKLDNLRNELVNKLTLEVYKGT